MKSPHWQTQNQWFGPYWIQYCLPNNIALLVIVKKFDPNFILVNINKLKLYKTPNVFPQEATIKGGIEDLMAIPHQNFVLEYKFNDQHH
jgi:hypothetical protein